MDWKGAGLGRGNEDSTQGSIASTSQLPTHQGGVGPYVLPKGDFIHVSTLEIQTRVDAIVHHCNASFVRLAIKRDAFAALAVYVIQLQAPGPPKPPWKHGAKAADDTDSDDDGTPPWNTCAVACRGDPMGRNAPSSKAASSIDPMGSASQALPTGPPPGSQECSTCTEHCAISRGHIIQAKCKSKLNNNCRFVQHRYAQFAKDRKIPHASKWHSGFAKIVSRQIPPIAVCATYAGCIPLVPTTSPRASQANVHTYYAAPFDISTTVASRGRDDPLWVTHPEGTQGNGTTPHWTGSSPQRRPNAFPGRNVKLQEPFETSSQGCGGNGNRLRQAAHPDPARQHRTDHHSYLWSPRAAHAYPPQATHGHATPETSHSRVERRLLMQCCPRSNPPTRRCSSAPGAALAETAPTSPHRAKAMPEPASVSPNLEAHSEPMGNRKPSPKVTATAAAAHVANIFGRNSGRPCFTSNCNLSESTNDGGVVSILLKRPSRARRRGVDDLEYKPRHPSRPTNT